MTAGAPRKELGPTINPWKMFQGSFIPNAVMQLPRRRLSADAKTCYGRLLQFAGKRGVAFPRVSLLALEIGQSRRSVERALKQLRGAGLITTKQRGRKRGGVGRSALISFHWPADIFGEVCTATFAPPRVAGQNGNAPPRAAGQKPPAPIVRARGLEESHKHEVSHRSAGGRPHGRSAVFTERGNPRGQERVAKLLGAIGGPGKRI